LLYGAETCRTNHKIESRLRGFEGRCCAASLTLTWGTALKTAQDRRAWKVIIEASCITSHDEIR